MKYLSYIAALFLALPGRCVAQEIRVLDPAGLTRAVQATADAMSVEVTVTKAESRPPGGAVLVQTSGLADDRAEAGVGNRYLFSTVPPGTWQVKLNDSGEQISRVRIFR